MTSFIDSILQEIGLEKKPSALEANALASAVAAQSAAQNAPYVPKLDTSGPFVEVIVPLKSIATPYVTGSGAGLITQVGAAVPFSIPGVQLLYRQSGSTPASLAILLGGQLHKVIPGQSISAPFDRFTILNRESFINADRNVQNNYFQGEAHLVVTTLPGARFEEPAYFTRPPFVPIPLIGSLDGQTFVQGVQNFVGDRLSTVRVVVLGNGAGSFGGGGSTLAVGDTVTLTVTEIPAVDYPKGLPAAQIAVDPVAWIVGVPIVHPSTTVTYPGGLLYIVDLSVAGYGPFLQLNVTVNNGHVTKYVALGVA